MDEQRKWFSEMESTPGEDAVKTVDMATKESEHDTDSVVKAAAGLDRTDGNFERSSAEGKMPSNSITGYREIACDGKDSSMWQPVLLASSRYCHSHPAEATRTLISQRPQHQARPLKARVVVCDVLAIQYFLIKVCTLCLDIMLLLT